MHPPLLPPATLHHQFSLSDIKSATNNFSDDLIIGKGGFGNVYKATVSTVREKTITVAVKRWNSDLKQGAVEFWTEVNLLTNCRHIHLISLIGYCVDLDANEMILVYEYMANGTLADHIYKSNEYSSYLNWEQRLKICIGVARGLEYLHTGTGIDEMVIHRDLKCSNILLDADLSAKISDFGLCKKYSGDRPYTPIIASVKGTFANMDPKYLTTHELSTKTDVYAFGVVLLEVFCGRRSLDFEVADRKKRLVLWAAQCIREGVAHRIIDPGLRGRVADAGLRIFLDITMQCLLDRPKKRPTLAVVVGKLEIALGLQDTTYSSSSSVDDVFVKYFNQVAYSTNSSTSANSDVEPSRHSLEFGSSKTHTIKQEPGSESKSATNNRRFDELNANVSVHSTVASTSKTSMILSHNKDDAYEKMIRRINPLIVVIDCSSNNSAIIKVNGTYKQNALLDIVQVLTDFDIIFTSASMTSDRSWFMNVFNVTNREGGQIIEEDISEYIQKALGSDTSFNASMISSTDNTVIEFVGSDRPGLLSEVCTVLTDLRCNVLNANMWTHNSRSAFIVQLTDEESGAAVTDPTRLYTIKKRLSNVLKVSNDAREAKIVVSHSIINNERRLHQMMLEDRDFERGNRSGLAETQRPDVNVVNWYNKHCSVVTVSCKDRPKLLFDTICTLTDMEYVVFHGSVNVKGPKAYQEYCIRHVDGSLAKSEGERQRIIQCIEAAIERRSSEGLKLELCTTDRMGLLSDVTRIFRENSLTVTRAEVATRGGKAINTFYVRDASGYPVDSKIIDSIRKKIGQTILKVKLNPQDSNESPQESPSRFPFGGLFKSASELSNLGQNSLSLLRYKFFSSNSG